MALNSGNLEADLKSAFQSGMDGASSDDVAASIADAIVAYGSGATVFMLPGPILIPGAPPIPSTGMGQTLDSALHDSGWMALFSGIKSQHDSQDATYMTMAIAVQTFVNTSFTLFQHSIGHMATGATVMAAPPALSSVPPAGLGGASMDAIAAQMASLIHASFLSSIFTGAGVAIDGGLGLVTGTLI